MTKVSLKYLKDLELNDILKYYDDGNYIDGDNLKDIYYYLYYCEKSGKKSGQYSPEFLEKSKDSKKLREINRELKKFVSIKDIYSEEYILKNLKIVPYT